MRNTTVGRPSESFRTEGEILVFGTTLGPCNTPDRKVGNGTQTPSWRPSPLSPESIWKVTLSGKVSTWGDTVTVTSTQDVLEGRSLSPSHILRVTKVSPFLFHRPVWPVRRGLLLLGVWLVLLLTVETVLRVLVSLTPTSNTQLRKAPLRAPRLPRLPRNGLLLWSYR